jgi:hypothetical protein
MFPNFWRYWSILSIFYHRHIVTFCISFAAFFCHRISKSNFILFYFEQYINFEYLMFCIFGFRPGLHDLFVRGIIINIISGKFRYI